MARAAHWQTERDDAAGAGCVVVLLVGLVALGIVGLAVLWLLRHNLGFG